MKKLVIASVLTLFSTMTLADTVIMTKTQSWKSVPVTVDSENHTYTVTETTLPEGDYYYTYSGYRCLREKVDVVGVDPVVFKASVANGTDIYCYPES